MKITYICLYNNDEQLNQFLLPSMDLLRKKGRCFDLILVDSKNKGYKSAAQGFNKTIEEKWDEIGEAVCFIHQDIRFDNVLFHDRLCKEFEVNPLQILGTAGIIKGESVRSNLKYWGDGSFITSLHIEGSDKIETESLDECCFATSKQVLMQIRFDEMVCFHWHLYAVDFCYASKIAGYPSFVLPESVYHKYNNKGGLYRDKFYLQSMWKLLTKYKKITSYICAPCFFYLRTDWRGKIRVLITYIHHLYFLRDY